MTVFKEIILRQDVNQKTHVSKMILLQSTIQPFTNTSPDNPSPYNPSLILRHTTLHHTTLH